MTAPAPRLTQEERRERESDALARARHNQSLANYPTIFAHFMAEGIEEDDIEPRVNVLTYNAWRAVGRQVRRGEKGCAVTTWAPRRTTNPDGTVTLGKPVPRTAIVFHVTQTDAIDPSRD